MSDLAYVVMNGDRPVAAATDLAVAQAHALTAATRYQPEPLPEHRWDERLDVWELMVKGRTGRWSKAYHSVHAIPAI